MSMSSDANRCTFVLDRSAAVAAFGIWDIGAGSFFQGNNIDLKVPEEALTEFTSGETQGSLWSLSASNIDENQSTANRTRNTSSTSSSIFINPQGQLTTLSGVNTCPVQISSVVLPLSTSAKLDNYYLALASALQSGTASGVFLCSDDKPMANASTTANISHLWSMDILCLMYDHNFVSGQKARRVYEKVSRIDSRHVPRRVKTFRSYYDGNWAPTKRELFRLFRGSSQ